MFLYAIDNSLEDLSQGKPNIDEYFRIGTSAEVRNCTKCESLLKVQGREKLDFPKL